MKTRYKKLGIIFSMIMMMALGGKAFATEDFEMINEEKPQILVNAVNAGTGTTSEGEFVEIVRTSEKSLLLTGLSICYKNSGGTVLSVYDFPEGAIMTGESLLLVRMKKADIQELEEKGEEKPGDLLYSSPDLAQGNGEIFFGLNGCNTSETKTLGGVKWGKDSEYTDSIGKGVSLVLNETREKYEYISNYEAEFTPGRKNIFIPEGGKGDEKGEPQCRGVIFSEILTFYENDRGEQFIEMYNTNATQVNLKGCFVKYKNKNYELTGIVPAQGYLAFYPKAFTMTKDPTSSNTLELIDADGELVDSLTYYNGQKKGVSYAMFGYDGEGKEKWMQTYNATPGAENIYQQYMTCEDGKVLNEETGKCVKPSNENATLAACPEGSYRNPLTNRCKKYDAETTSAEGKPCAEGYERNPATGRCRKIVNNEGAEYGLARTETITEKSSFIAVWVIVGLGVLGALYVLYQYKDDIKAKIRRK